MNYNEYVRKHRYNDFESKEYKEELEVSCFADSVLND